MKLAFSSNAYMHFSIEDTIEKIAEPGLYAASKCWPTCRTPGPPACCRSARIRSAGAWKSIGLAISNINAFMMNAMADPRQPYWHPGWTDPDPHYRAIRREHTKRALHLAQELGRRTSRPSRAAS